MKIKISCGILLFRREITGLEVLLVHPGGPFWKNKNEGAWTIPKGEPQVNEDFLTTAQREFLEETGFKVSPPFLDLGTAIQKSGKTVYAWAAEGNLDVATIKSNTTIIHWPPKSGRSLEIPEIDKAAWFLLKEAAQLINAAQTVFLEGLVQLLADEKQLLLYQISFTTKTAFL